MTCMRIVDAAVALHGDLRRDDIRVLYQTGRALHEVPFTMIDRWACRPWNRRLSRRDGARRVHRPRIQDRA